MNGSCYSKVIKALKTLGTLSGISGLSGGKKGYFAWCGGWFKNMYCICALTWALEVMLVPLTFYFTFPFLYQIHFCICCNFLPQASNASMYGVVRI